MVKSNLIISAFHNEHQLPGSQENLRIMRHKEDWDAKQWRSLRAETIVQRKIASRRGDKGGGVDERVLRSQLSEVDISIKLEKKWN